MSKYLHRFLRHTTLVMTAVVVGCTTTGRDGLEHSTAARSLHHEQGTAEEASSDAPRLATELLQEAEQEFRTANSAQERGDYEAALRHYNRMLELLVEADLDPSVFYNLRTEFERILGGRQEQAEGFPEGAPDRWSPGVDRAHVAAHPLSFPEELRPRVETEIREIQELYPRSFQYGLNRSAKYMPHIQEQFRNAGLPEDLAWLAMVESQFTPKIVSPAGAGGMWQFMRATGARYGLRVDNYVDERYNWEKATQAAIAYLSDLHTRFSGEWPLAVSAYNMGEGGVERCVAMNGGETELIRLLEQPPASNVMKNETKKFYPRLLASIEVAKNPQQYGFRYEPQAPDVTVRVPVRGAYSLAALDSACGLPEGTLRQLNSDLIRGVTPPTGEHMLAIPAQANDRIHLALSNVPQDKKSLSAAVARTETSSKSGSASTAKSGGGTTHTVRRGETLSSIANRYGVEVKDLMAANKLKSSSHLLAGKKLAVPASGSAKAPAAPAPEKPVAVAKADTTVKAPAAASATRTYKVKSGDTLFDIAMREGCTVDQLLKWNDIKSPRGLKAGEVLSIGSGSSSTAAPKAAEPQQTVHVVKAGEFPAKIAGQYGVSVDDLLKWNNLSKNSSIHAGQKLTVRGGKTQTAKAEAPAAAPAQAKPVTHVVAKGETASTIAAKYGVGLSQFLSWNKLTSKSTLQVGQKCVVYPANGKSAAAAPAGPKKIEHKVASGENPTTIAKKHGVKVDDLFKWNGWKKGHTLKVGDKVVIQK